MISACCWALSWIHQTVRIPCLTVEDPNRKVPDLYFKVVDPKLQVADLKAEVGERRSCGIPPQFNPCHKLQLKCKTTDELKVALKIIREELPQEHIFTPDPRQAQVTWIMNHAYIITVERSSDNDVDQHGMLTKCLHNMHDDCLLFTIAIRTYIMHALHKVCIIKSRSCNNIKYMCNVKYKKIPLKVNVYNTKTSSAQPDPTQARAPALVTRICAKFVLK